MDCAREMGFAVLSILAQADFDGLVVSEVSIEYQSSRELVLQRHLPLDRFA
jgi:hypothetical protein